MTKEDILKLRPGRNRVVVKLDPLIDSVSFKSGQELYIETKYEPANHTQIRGTVHCPPESLYFNKKDIGNSIEWETEVEIEKGDVVYMEYLGVMLALASKWDAAASYENPTYVEDEDGALYIMIRYQDIYFKVKPSATSSEKIELSDIVPVNGFVIARGIDVGLKSEEIIIPDQLKVVWSDKWAEVIVAGKPCTNFVDTKYSDKGEINKGDLVCFGMYCNQRIEDTLHRKLFPDDPEHPYVVIQRKWIKGKVDNKHKKLIMSGDIK